MTQSEKESDASRVERYAENGCGGTKGLIRFGLRVNNDARLMENEACANAAAEHGVVGELIAAQIRSRMKD